MTEQNGEVVMEQSRPERKPRKERKPWRKRMKNAVLSPLHLFQKYVLRKKRRQRRGNKSREVLPDINEAARTAAVEAAKKRKLPCYFLFLGLSQSGKSTTISKLFNTKRPAKSTPSNSNLLDIYQNPAIGDGLPFKIVDTPGFSGLNADHEPDNEIALALSSFLRRDIPNRIPTVTFLVAPMEDDVEAQSKFKVMLKTLTHFKKNITDLHHSNLVLLLTHSQKMEETKSNSEMGKIIKSYQSSLSSLFPSASNPIPVIPIENFRHTRGDKKSKGGNNVVRYHDLIFEALQKFAVYKEEYILHQVVEWLSSTSKSFSVPLKKESFPLMRYLPPGMMHDISDEFARLSCQPYFVLCDRDLPDQNENTNEKSVKGKSASKKFQTCIPAGSQLVLANKTVINIEDCLVGDKLLSLDFCPSVITKIRETNLEENGDAIIGTIYCTLEKETSEGKEKLIYKYENGSFATVNMAKANILERVASTKTAYFIEIDLSDGTFVFNGFPCFVECEG